LEDAIGLLRLWQASLLSIVSKARELALIMKGLMSGHQPVTQFCQLLHGALP